MCDLAEEELSEYLAWRALADAPTPVLERRKRSARWVVPLEAGPAEGPIPVAA